MSAGETQFGDTFDANRAVDEEHRARVVKIALGIELDFGSHKEAQLIPPPAPEDTHEA